MRGYHTRKYLIPRKLATNRILANYVDRLVKSYIEVIPILLISTHIYQTTKIFSVTN